MRRIVGDLAEPPGDKATGGQSVFKLYKFLSSHYSGQAKPQGRVTPMRFRSDSLRSESLAEGCCRRSDCSQVVDISFLGTISDKRISLTSSCRLLIARHLDAVVVITRSAETPASISFHEPRRCMICPVPGELLHREARGSPNQRAAKGGSRRDGLFSS